MPSKAFDAPLRDILRHIDLIATFVDGLDRSQFFDDTRTVYAVTRCLEIISEALRRVTAEQKARHSSIPWREIAGAGNVYRHDYEDVAARYIWDTIQHDLPSLRIAIEQEIDRLGQGR